MEADIFFGVSLNNSNRDRCLLPAVSDRCTSRDGTMRGGASRKLITPGGVPGNLFGPTNPVESPESSELFGEPPQEAPKTPLNGNGVHVATPATSARNTGNYSEN